MEHPEPRAGRIGGQRRRTGRRARPARRGRGLPAGGFNRTDLHAVRRRTGALEPVGGPSGVPGVDCAIQAFDGLAVRSHHGAWGAFRQRERPAAPPRGQCRRAGASTPCRASRLSGSCRDRPRLRRFWTEAQDTAAMRGRGGPYPPALPGTSAEAAVEDAGPPDRALPTAETPDRDA